MTEYLLPVSSILVAIYLFFFISHSFILSIRLCFLLQILASVAWVSLIGYNGTDIEYYLQYTQNYSFQNPFFDGSVMEFSVGLFTAFIKSILFIGDPQAIMTAYRIILISFFPIFLLFSQRRSRLSVNIVFHSVLAFLFLMPYTFLSFANIVNNGLAITLLFYVFYMLLPSALDFSLRPSLLNSDKYIIIPVLLMLAFFAHPFGRATVIVISSVMIVIYLLVKIKLFRLIYSHSKQIMFLLYLLPCLILLSFMSVPYASSTISDSTSLISSLLLLFTLYLSRSYISSYYRAYRQIIADYKSGKHAYYCNLMWYVCLSFSIYALLVSLLGLGLAAERFIAAAINLNIALALSICFYQKKCVLPLVSAQLWNKNILSVNVTPLTVIDIGLFATIAAINVYFYTSNAFLYNI